MAREVVSYALDDATVVTFEIEPPSGFQPAGAGRVIGGVREAITPAVEAAGLVLDKAKQAAPDEIEVKFGIKVSGTANWMIAKAASEANFEVTLVWRPKESPAAADPAAPDAG
ncbi:CU044_2847 family protein [Streptomyces sp. NPDC059766]|uniref:CU044_2847 family protein n=1 Tax=Streptomyces sp. NPDC059766 TaxID=3346940 RepID=UPI00364ABC2A